MNTWIEYQPKRERDKAFHDIKLRDGEVVECCWPNADSWTPVDGPRAGDTIKDYRVTHIRRGRHPMDDPAFKNGDRVQVCHNPLCGHSASIVGAVDLVARFKDSDHPDETMVTVLRDGGGVCGPFHLDEVTKL